MNWLNNLFNRKGSSTRVKNQYSSEAEFVAENYTIVKKILSSYGYNNIERRLNDLCEMISCQTLLLCQKQRGISAFSVIDANEEYKEYIGKQFMWQHSQVAASNEARQILIQLPFQNLDGQAFISIPVKNKRNMLTGILLGISNRQITNIDEKTRMLHLMSPFFDSELQVKQLQAQVSQYEQKISALNQTVEVVTSDLNREKTRSEEAKNHKNMFLEYFSHEIRTPMNVIVGFADLLETAETTEDRHNFIEMIKQNSQLMLSTIENMIEIDEMQSVNLFKPAAPQQLNVLLDEILANTEKIIKESGKKIEIEHYYGLETPYDTIWNSEECIRKTLEQIMSNSVKFTENGGNIILNYNMTHKEITFSVKDTGCGIRVGDEEKIFNSNVNVAGGFQNDMGSAKGLALARKYVQLAGGRIWVDTNYHDGACICFSIPAGKL